MCGGLGVIWGLVLLVFILIVLLPCVGGRLLFNDVCFPGHVCGCVFLAFWTHGTYF